MQKHRAISDQLVFELIDVAQDIAHFKDAKTKQYIGCNQATLTSFGLRQMKQVLGHTVNDINQVMSPYWGSQYAGQVDHLDRLVIQQQDKIQQQETVILSDGNLKLQNLIKIPIFGVIQRNIQGIFTFTQNLTHTLNVENLYTLYRRRYPKMEAIKRLLIHLGVSRYFIILPTEAELRVLIARIYQDSYKGIANLLHLAPKTIEMHLYNLRSKIINGDLNIVLTAVK